MLENNILKSVNVLNNFKNNTVWSSEASGVYSNKLNELINDLNNELSKIDSFEEALGLLEQLKSIDDDIKILESQKWSMPIGENAIPENIERVNNHNSSINKSIEEKIEARLLIKDEIIGILSGLGGSVDIPVIMIPDLDSSCIVETYENGYLCEFTISTDKGMETYQVYIPKTYTEDVSVVIYDHGDGGYNDNWEPLMEEFANDKVDCVVIGSRRLDSAAYYSDIVNRLGISPSSPISISHSGGTCKGAILEYVQLMDEGKAKNGIFAVMDGNTPGSWWESQGYIDKFKENNTIMLNFGTYRDRNYNEYKNNYEFIAKNYDINSLIFIDRTANKDTMVTHGMSSHAVVNINLTESNTLQYLSGTGTLPEIYDVYRYMPDNPNADDNGFVLLSYEEVNTIDKIYEMFGVEK